MRLHWLTLTPQKYPPPDPLTTYPSPLTTKPSLSHWLITHTLQN